MAYKKLDPEFKAKWLKSLRSGRYKRTQETLRSEVYGGYGYCCLGVACNIIDRTKWRKGTESEFDYGSLPGSAGIEQAKDGKFPFRIDPEAVVVLIEMNDSTKIVNDAGDEVDDGAGYGAGYTVPMYTFPEIADWIEENL